MAIFPRHPTMSTFSMMLHFVFFHAAALWLPFPFCSCAMTTFSTQRRYVYFFHAALLRLLSCADSGIFVGGGGPGQSDKKSSDNVFFSIILSLFYRSQMVNFKENFHFSRLRRGSNFFLALGVQLFPGRESNCLFPIEPHITCDSPGGPDPLSPPLDPRLTFSSFPTPLLWYFSTLPRPPPPPDANS